MQHYSERLNRDFVDGDLLSIPEVVGVIKANSDRDELSDRAVSDLARIHGLRRERPSPRAVLYHYSEVKDLVVAKQRGRRAQDNPSPTALRQRKFKARRKEHQLDEPGDQELQRVG